MCMSCGCKQPNEDHGDDRNITMRDLEQAAEAAGADTQTVARNIQEGFQGGMATSGVGSQRGGQYAGQGPVSDEFSGSGSTGEMGRQGKKYQGGDEPSGRAPN